MEKQPLVSLDTQVLTLTNTGSSNLTISANSLSGDASLSMTTTCGATVVPSASCIFTVTFHPTAAGTFNGVLSVTDTAPGPQTIPISGSGALSTDATQTKGVDIIGEIAKAFHICLKGFSEHEVRQQFRWRYVWFLSASHSDFAPRHFRGNWVEGKRTGYGPRCLSFLSRLLPCVSWLF